MGCGCIQAKMMFWGFFFIGHRLPKACCGLGLLPQSMPSQPPETYLTTLALEVRYFCKTVTP